LQGWDALCKDGGKLYKDGVKFARMGYTLQGWDALCKGGVHFARMVVNFTRVG